VSVLPEANYEACESSLTHQSSWPFAVWGVDIVGILPRALGGFRFLFVIIDIFIKWMETTPVVNITQEASVKFLKSIIYRFGILKRVLTDNGTHLKGAKFLRCCADFGIHHQHSSAAHPQTNKQVERTNGLLLQGMKTRMFQDFGGERQELAPGATLSFMGPPDQYQ
jgi:transposase InsO family protein